MRNACQQDASGKRPRMRVQSKKPEGAKRKDRGTFAWDVLLVMIKLLLSFGCLTDNFIYSILLYNPFYQFSE